MEALHQLLHVHSTSSSSAQCPLLSRLQRRHQKRLMLQAWKCLREFPCNGARRLEITQKHPHTSTHFELWPRQFSSERLRSTVTPCLSFPRGRKTCGLFFYFSLLSPPFLVFSRVPASGSYSVPSLSSSPSLWLGWRLMGADMMVALSSPSKLM